MNRDDEKNSCCRGLGDLLVPRFFKALGDSTRVAILARLAQGCGPSTVGSVAGCCPVDLSVVSRHLRVLRDAGIVVAEKRGKEVFYSVRYDELARTLRQLADAIDACCPPSRSTGGADDVPPSGKE